MLLIKKQDIFVYTLILCATLFFSFPLITSAQTVNIPDVNLRAAIASALGKASNARITLREVETLTRLTANNRGISDLTGLEAATGLESIELHHNQISDLSALAGLIKLHTIRIGGNLISDLSPITGLISLARLNISENLVSNLSPVAGLTNLLSINFGNNSVFDLSPLAELKNLRHVKVSHNNISDLSPLAGLSNLRRFDSWGNPLSDLSALVGLEIIDICGGEPDISTLEGARNLKELYLLGCGVSDVSPVAKLTGLTRLGLAGNRISDISLLAKLTDLKWLELADNKISDVSPLAQLKNLTWLHIGGNMISDFSPLDGLREHIKLIWYNNPGFPQGGPKIEGPWLWVLLPEMEMESRFEDKVDLLAEVSGGAVTEVKVSTNGAIEGNPVGDNVWYSDKIPPTGRNNIAEVLTEEVLAGPFVSGVIYGCVLLYTPRQQEVMLFAGNDGGGKAWLNGTLVHEEIQGTRGADYQHFVPVTLKEGVNVLLVATRTGGNGFWGFEPDAEYTVLNPRVGYTFSQPIIDAGDTFTLEIRAEDIYNLAGWQFDIAFDPTMLEAVEVSEGNFLNPEGSATFFQEGRIDNATGKITKLSSARLSEAGVSGSGTLLSVTFTAKTAGQTQLRLDNFQLAAVTGTPITAGPHEIVITIEERLATADVNRDGQVSILDMVLVARRFGETVPANSAVDVNGDGVISILDLIIVASNLGESTDAAAPSVLAVDGIHRLDTAMIQAWIAQAALENDGSIAFQRGIANLQRLLASLIPEKTVLLANYPNPFNPETWIPYHLADPSNVQITIYDTRGSIIRHLKLGHQHPGYYATKDRAAYWDGRNEVGERVANGIYFYQLQADQVSFLRKMVILK